MQGAQYAGNKTDSGLLVDATRKRPMPPLALPTRPYMEHARALWEELGLPALNVQAPWHGYTLDDWTDTWETYARRTAAGDWEETGRETLAAPAQGADARNAGAARQAKEGVKFLNCDKETSELRVETKTWRAFPICSNPTCRPSTRSSWRGRSRSTARWPTTRRRRRR